MSALETFLFQRAAGDLIPWSCQVEAAERFGLTLAEVEAVILEGDLLPARYQRNRHTITVADQRTLFAGTVAVVGCGGLGGYIVEELARLGVGTIVAIDPDVFEEHNLNRQLLSSPANLGRPKVEAAAARVEEINPAVSLKPFQVAYAPDNGAELLGDAQVVVDALDSIPTRLALAATCTELDLPLVHGAIGGWYGQVATQFPGDDTIQKIYARWTEGKGLEQRLGNPSFTPALVASIQVAEVCKILLGKGETLRHRKLVVNLLDMEFHEVAFEPRLSAGAE